jgi:hypothetical protein
MLGVRAELWQAIPALPDAGEQTLLSRRKSQRVFDQAYPFQQSADLTSACIVAGCV